MAKLSKSEWKLRYYSPELGSRAYWKWQDRHTDMESALKKYKDVGLLKKAFLKEHAKYKEAEERVFKISDYKGNRQHERGAQRNQWGENLRDRAYQKAVNLKSERLERTGIFANELVRRGALSGDLAWELLKAYKTRSPERVFDDIKWTLNQEMSRNKSNKRGKATGKSGG